MRRVLEILFKVSTYFLLIGLIGYASFYSALFTISIMPFSSSLVKLVTASASDLQADVSKLLFRQLVLSRPQLRAIPVQLPLVILRRIFPPFNGLCNTVGNVFNGIFRRGRTENNTLNSESQPNLADIQMPSYSDFQEDIGTWNIRDGKLDSPVLKLNSLNFIGCLIFLLCFTVYFVLYSSFSIFVLDRILQATGNMQHIFHRFYPELKQGKNTRTASSKLDVNKSALDIDATNFIDY